MDNAGFETFFRGPIQRNQHRQRPRPGRTGHLNPYRQHYPFMSPAMNQVLMTRPHGITMTAFLVDMLATMLADRVVAGHFQNTLSRETFHHRDRQSLCQHQT